MYCSELVWKCYHEVLGIKLCEPKPYEAYNLDDPLVSNVIIKRFGGRKNLPANHQVVAPSDIVESKLLKNITAEYKAK